MSRFELVAAAPDQRACIDALVQLYHYDASEWFPLDLQPDGRFACRPVDRLWTSATRFPLLIRVEGKLAGFASVDKEVTHPQSDWNMADFFIVRRYRGQGLGREIAHQLFKSYKGRWEIYQVAENTQATAFWRAVIRAFVADDWSESARIIDGRPSLQQVFESR